MRRLVPALALALLATVGSAAAARAQGRFAALYHAHDCFSVRDSLAALRGPETPDIAFYRGWVAAAFNQPARATSELARFLASDTAAADSSLRVAAQQLLADGLVRQFRYGEAGDAYARLASTVSESERAEVRNDATLFRALRDVPPQTVTVAADVSLPVTRDKAGLLTIPVQSGAATENFVFDTGANLSTVTESAARAFGFHIVDQTIQVGAATGGKTAARLGVAPELHLGSAVVRNAVFLVMPDSALAFPPIQYQIHGIVGQPVIAALGEVTLTRDGHLRVPAHPSAPARDAEPNLCLDGLDNLVRVTYAGEPHVFGLDTGARSTSLFPAFHDRHAAVVEAGAAKTVRVGGAGGFRTAQAYTLPSLTLSVGGAEATLQGVDAYTAPLGGRSHYALGDLGQDFISRFAEMTLDYRAMQLRFR